MLLTEQIFGSSLPDYASQADAHLARLSRATTALAAKKAADVELKASLEALGWPSEKISLLMGASK